MHQATSIVGILALCVGCAHGPASPSSIPISEQAQAAESPSQPSASFEAALDSEGKVQPEAVQAWVTQPAGIRVLDVRDPAEFSEELGHIPGADNVPLAELEQASAEWDPASPIVVVCKSGKRSATATEQLKARGFTHVGFMAGGMQRWNDEGRPVERGEPVHHAAR